MPRPDLDPARPAAWRLARLTRQGLPWTVLLLLIFAFQAIF